MDAALRIWVPKAGGSSVKEALKADAPFYGHVGETFLQPTIHEKAVVFSVGHLTPRMLVERGLFTPSKLRNIWTFANVRNPWARFVSLWTAMGREAASGYTGGFPDFLTRIFDDPTQTNKKEKTPLGATTEDFFTLDGEMMVNHVCRVESLSNDWQDVAERLGLQNLKIGKANAHDHYHYMEYFDPHPDLIEQVARKERWAIETFGYSYGD